MERMNEALIQKQFLYDEHHARYKHFRKFMHGKVIDCACGIGYASKIVLANSAVDSYLGVDISDEAVDLASKNFSIENEATFVKGNICDLEYESHSFDTFISMETLEHLEDPNIAIREIKRVLKSTGVFIGSVPVDEYDEKCEAVYGENIYHIQRFNRKALETLLSSEFKYVYIGIMTREIVSKYEPINAESDGIKEDILSHKYNADHGSFLFICSNQPIEVDFHNKFYLAQSLVEYDQEQVIPVFNSMRYAEKLALEREDIINNTEIAYQIKVRKLQDKIEELQIEIGNRQNEQSLTKTNEGGILRGLISQVKQRILNYRKKQ
ncbi:bifunctional 2-polyprenyl-6-hydroxyphenol methylase/3-demethylubiquinol 3-O-methyltransferase UbiG [Photobacterium sp. OFAV2-7]|uniref:class I SAM-dependent methyltransferase n=1 Tax=Photobacterium sp. OFAV2-7 TaxID=2917748 RepID=UPI001EF460EF|nr:class I SAM-dependent methyltransferase [Photobacterium sp. OFAV2-7]MCG7586639.1 class I SAM-dependent methyltransferase [Photobacterium sp. OFAV2-7]